MMSKANIEFMESGDRCYIIGASKGTLRKFERQLLEEDWRMIRDGLEVKMCPRTSCENRKWKKEVIDRRIGKIMAKNSRAAGLYHVSVKDASGRAVASWKIDNGWREWATNPVGSLRS